ncbi:hypothetical protein C8J56DRAFT_891012 [Mycena floridula]|nr:hypothetical protein C8J56DRAFT_891012 [Mycena floridula]
MHGKELGGGGNTFRSGNNVLRRLENGRGSLLKCILMSQAKNSDVHVEIEKSKHRFKCTAFNLTFSCTREADPGYLKCGAIDDSMRRSSSGLIKSFSIMDGFFLHHFREIEVIWQNSTPTRLIAEGERRISIDRALLTAESVEGKVKFKFSSITRLAKGDKERSDWVTESSRSRHHPDAPNDIEAIWHEASPNALFFRRDESGTKPFSDWKRSNGLKSNGAINFKNVPGKMHETARELGNSLIPPEAESRPQFRAKRNNQHREPNIEPIEIGSVTCGQRRAWRPKRKKYVAGTTTVLTWSSQHSVGSTSLTPGYRHQNLCDAPLVVKSVGNPKAGSALAVYATAPTSDSQEWKGGRYTYTCCPASRLMSKKGRDFEET